MIIKKQILNYLKHEKIGEKDKKYRKQSDKVAGLTGELVRGARDIKMLNAKTSFLKKLDNEIIIQSEDNFDLRNVDMNYNLVISFIKSILDYIAIILIIVLISNNTITIAIGLVLYNYRNTVLTSFMDNVSELLEKCKNFNISFERVFTIIGNKQYKNTGGEIFE